MQITTKNWNPEIKSGIIKSGKGQLEKEIDKQIFGQEFEINLAIDNFEQDAEHAKLTLAINSGLQRFSDLPYLYANYGIPIKESEDPETQQSLQRIVAEIEDNLIAVNINKIVQRFQDRFSKTADLIGCSCCGIRHFLSSTNSYHTLQVKELNILQLSNEKRKEYEEVNAPFRNAISVYEAEDKQLYYLHSEFVEKKETAKSELQEIVQICNDCFQSLRRHQLPTYSLANGVDFGKPWKIGLPAPTLIEELLITKNRLYVYIFKFTAGLTEMSQSGKVGHVLVLPQTIEAVEITRQNMFQNKKMETKIFPRVQQFSKFATVVFVGDKLRWECFIHENKKTIQELFIRPEVVLLWCHALKSLHPSYKDDEVDSSQHMVEQLILLSDALLADVTFIDNETDIRIEQLATSKQEDISLSNEDKPKSEDMCILTTSFITKNHPASTDEHETASSVFKGLLKAFLDADEIKSIPHEGSISNERNSIMLARKDNETDKDCHHQSNEETGNMFNEHVKIQVGVKRELTNEFQHNDELLYETFPFLFLLGKGLQSKGTLSTKTIEHMMHQYSGQFGKCTRISFLLFEQLQRHAACREMKSEVKSHPKSVLQFGNMVKQPSFLHGLQEAVKNPTAEDSKKLLARITPHIHSCTPKVPFSPAQRKSSMKHIYIPCI